MSKIDPKFEKLKREIEEEKRRIYMEKYGPLGQLDETSLNPLKKYEDFF